MRIIETEVYTFDELGDKAKERARDWWRSYPDAFSSDTVLDDAAEIAALLGIELKQRPYRTMGGETRYENCIWWSGFSSQGDGACYEGRYRYRKGSVRAVLAYAPTDTELHGIARGLAAIQKRYGYQVVVDIGCSGNRTMNFDDVGGRELSDEDFKSIRDFLRDFATWIYRQLESDYNYQMADEQVDEAIRCNEYEFTKEGKPA